MTITRGWRIVPVGLGLVVATATCGTGVAAGVHATSGAVAASETGFANSASVHPPTRTSWSLPQALRDLTSQGAPLALSPDSFVAAEAHLNAEGTSTSLGLYAWTTAGDLLWSYDPPGLTSMSAPVSDDGAILAEVVTQTSASADGTQDLVRLSPTHV